jgi:hypothetical protein
MVPPWGTAACVATAWSLPARPLEHAILVPMSGVAALGLGIFRAHPVAAEGTPTTIPASVTVVGTGQIRLIVTEGSGRPCESSDNHVLFNGHARAGDEVKLTVAAAIGAG